MHTSHLYVLGRGANWEREDNLIMKVAQGNRFATLIQIAVPPVAINISLKAVNPVHRFPVSQLVWPLTKKKYTVFYILYKYIYENASFV